MLRTRWSRRPRTPARGCSAAGKDHEEASVVAIDGTVTDGPHPESREYLGGFAAVDVPSREEALEWLPRWPSPAAVLWRFESSWPTRPSDRMPITAS
jgi:hypothetical protein